LRLSEGRSGGPGFNTTVTPLKSGFEQRNIDWSEVRGKWDIGYGLVDRETNMFISEASIDALLAFFYAREGRAHGFRFRDWIDFNIGDPDNPTTDNQEIGQGDDTTVIFSSFKRYTSVVVYDRPIKKLVTARFHLLIENVEKTEGPDYSVDINTGIFTFVTAPASTGGSGVGGAEIVQLATEFDVPVRFDTDQMAMALEFFDTGSWPNIPILELRIA